MPQWVNTLAANHKGLGSISRTQMVERPVPTSCALTSKDTPFYASIYVQTCTFAHIESRTHTQMHTVKSKEGF